MGAPTDAKGASYAGQCAAGVGIKIPKYATKAARTKLKQMRDIKEVPNTMATFPVVITSFEMAMSDSQFLRGFQWKSVSFFFFLFLFIPLCFGGFIAFFLFPLLG